MDTDEELHYVRLTLDLIRKEAAKSSVVKYDDVLRKVKRELEAKHPHAAQSGDMDDPIRLSYQLDTIERLTPVRRQR